jgi:hypothetical protein
MREHLSEGETTRSLSRDNRYSSGNGGGVEGNRKDILKGRERRKRDKKSHETAAVLMARAELDSYAFLYRIPTFLLKKFTSLIQASEHWKSWITRQHGNVSKLHFRSSIRLERQASLQIYVEMLELRSTRIFTNLIFSEEWRLLGSYTVWLL